MSADRPLGDLQETYERATAVWRKSDELRVRQAGGEVIPYEEELSHRRNFLSVEEEGHALGYVSDRDVDHARQLLADVEHKHDQAGA